MKRKKPTITEYLLEDGKIVVIDDFMSPSEARTLSNFFDHKTYSRSIADKTSTGTVKQWVYNFSKEDLQGFEEKMIRDEISKHYDVKKFRFQNAICNVYSYGDVCFTHVDFYRTRPGITALIFANDIWEKDWGGEIMFFKKNDEAVYAITPKPGRLLLFHGFLKHRGGVPSRHCYEARKTFVLKYHI